LPAEGNGTGATPTADAYEWLHRNILFARPQADVKTVTVTSPLPGDGKTTTAAGLAVTLARRGLKVLLVDADLRRGTLGSLVQGQGQLGFSDLLAGTAPFHQVVRTREVGGGHVLHYLPTGALPPDSTRLLDSPRAAALMEWLRERFYLVVFDTPPINLFADAAVLAAQTDAVIVVARAGKTEYDALAHAAEQCRRGNLPVAGVVLNDVDPDRDRDYDGAYRWYEQAKSYYAQAS
ncbi:MAG TPA: CpsD/CapB family tyrosine-protein kinase, partial [Longimicrobium sp.]|nr:CpsD/CapB family tyrosine-protein kinase [Longimicrobium sp.]